jgi:hypothetical protein
MASSRPLPPNGAPPGPPEDPHFPDLAAYALGAMTPEEEAEFERTLADCADCRDELPRLRESVSMLEGMPPELLLDGPPEDADLLIGRTVRAIQASASASVSVSASESAPGVAGETRGGSAPSAVPVPSGPGEVVPLRRPARTGPRPRVWLVAAAAAVILLVVGGAFGRISAPQSHPPVASGPPATTPQDVVVPGTRSATALDAATGARLTVKVVPAAGWVRVSAAASGIRAGERCHLVVVSKSGQSVEAGSWLVSAAGAAQGTTLDGAALVAPSDVAAVRVQNSAGQVLVTTEI